MNCKINGKHDAIGSRYHVKSNHFELVTQKDVNVVKMQCKY